MSGPLTRRTLLAGVSAVGLARTLPAVAGAETTASAAFRVVRTRPDTAHDICHASGLVATAAAKGHRWVLMGFETNNTLHADNPPHWHISYNSGPDFNARTHNPHFWLDSDGRNFYNGMDVTGLGRLWYYVGDPAPIYDFIGTANGGRGDLAGTFTLREDGGIDIAAPTGPTYAIAAGRNGDLLDEVTVLRYDRLTGVLS